MKRTIETLYGLATLSEAEIKEYNNLNAKIEQYTTQRQWYENDLENYDELDPGYAETIAEIERLDAVIEALDGDVWMLCGGEW